MKAVPQQQYQLVPCPDKERSLQCGFLPDEVELQCRENSQQHHRRQSRSRPKPPSVGETVAEQQRQRQKYRRKKERKKKNKLKKLLQHYESSDKLKLILARIYEGRARFADIEQDIPAVVAGVLDQEVFFEILNESITNYIEDLAESIWDHLNEFTGPYELEDFIQQYEHFEDSPQFFTLLIEELCYTHEQIKCYSREVEKLIDTYVRGYCPNVRYIDQQYNLSKNTLNHLINCNSFLTFVVEQLQSFFGEHGQKLEGSEVEYQRQLLDLLKDVELSSLPVDSQNSTECEFGGSLPTPGIEFCDADGVRKVKQRKKKKKCRSTDPHPTQLLQYQPATEQDFDRMVAYSLQLLELPADRLECNFEQSWLEKLQAEMMHHKHS